MAKNIARDGAPKRLHSASNIHSGMHSRTRDGALLVGVTDHAAVESGGLPGTDGALRPMHRSTLPGKSVAAASVTPGHRHRTADALGGSAPGENHAKASREIDTALRDKVLDEAYAQGSLADHMARMQHVPAAPAFKPK